MRCIVEGHRPRVFQGVGEFSGSRYWVCVDCGKTELYQDNFAPAMNVAPQPLLSERQESRN